MFVLQSPFLGNDIFFILCLLEFYCDLEILLVFLPRILFLLLGVSDISLAGSATHGGGSCQFSLSYDGGSTWAVIHSIIGGCPLNSAYTFPVPNNIPSGNALFAWTWFNKVGNR